jgi:hypothetical protein
MSIRILGLAIVTAALLPELAAAQAPPATKTPRPPAATTPSQSGNCAPNTAATTGQGSDVDVAKPDGSNLSEKLAQSNGVLCPPAQGDHAIEATPPPGGRTPVIKPPGTPGSGDQSVQPK